MQVKQILSKHRNVSLLLAYLVALCYLLFLASSIQPDVFFQGDGGMKFIVVKQLCAKEGFKYLHLSQPVWVKEVWEKGFFPIKEPFIYPSAKGYVISFPPVFQIVSSFFYNLLGYRGLYIIPLLSTALLWLWVMAILRHFNIPNKKIILLFFILVFCSPLTVYGAMYWEHMPAVLFLFAGIAYLIKSNSSILFSACTGFLCGLSVWLRPEALALLLFYVLVLFVFKERKKASLLFAFLASMALPVISFFIFNKIVYSSFLGVHSYQVIDNPGIIPRLIRWLKNFLMINWLLLKFFPFVLLLLPVLFRWLIRKSPTSILIKQLLTITLLYCVFTPVMLPNTGGGQWGPRYFLPLIPIIVIIFSLAYDKGSYFMANNTFLTGFFVVSGMCYGLYLNCFRGGMQELRQGYHERILPALKFVREKNSKDIVVNSEHITMEMGAVFREYNFFLAEDSISLKKIIELLKQHQVKKILYISENKNDSSVTHILSRSHVRESIKKGRYFFKEYSTSTIYR